VNLIMNDQGYPRRPSLSCLRIAGAASLLVTSACFVADIEAIIAEYEVTEPSGGSGDSSSGVAASTSTSASAAAEGTTSSDTSTSGTATTADSGSGDDSGGSTTTTTTGPPPAVCGNGVVEDDELCDDGNDAPDDGCHACVSDSIVFITSELYQGFALGGFYGADLRCQGLAAKAGLPRFLTFKAWLSTSNTAAADRLLHSRGRYVLVNGLVVAHDWDALTSGTLINPIVVDEGSLTRDDAVWTGTLASGQPAFGSEFCGDWDDESAVTKDGPAGYSLSTDGWWSFYDHIGCANEVRLYCIEQLQGSEP
jgi:cysteine-rich repeat protein